MSDIDLAALEAAVHSLPERIKGPGGVVGLVKNGEVILRHAWGFADLDKRVPMTEVTLIPICSITKQFTCAALLDVVGDPARLDAPLARHLPNLEDRRPTVADLCNNQSGLRDYWALTVLHGAMADGVFSREDTARLFARMRKTHFEPGSHYSYSNGNFRILSDLIEGAAGKPLAEVYRDRLFGPAGMETAVLASDTSAPLNGVVGYEGNETVGYFPAANRIFWSGDAGIAASLDDMLAWERFIDRTRDDPDGLYNRISAPQPFADGTPSRYGFGLARETVDEIALTGHGGALRGFRARRLHAASERLSVVVMFNHEGDAHGTATAILRAALGRADAPAVKNAPTPEWNGNYLEPSSGLSLRITTTPAGLKVHFATSSEDLAVDADGIARSSSMTLTRDGDAIRMERPGENLRVTAHRIPAGNRDDIAGRFVSEELEASFEIVSAGGACYGAFEGFLGKGAMQPIHPVGRDVWRLSCRRSMDAPAPGDWTILVRRDVAGEVCGLTVGCWLARKVEYVKAG
ncbi:D-aminopeptidase [Rhizobium sp. ARZ01]|uniref:D-aminopeptidase n=1 Tax=Rhizobium sp. ARZ01 TaxID=2769313 RepID=UPI0017877760|nr:D-aminopeptidase [Rhizobium sp. ARZ01]MBD9374234.1 D-aminopeptidase [Rhizobium sp. ARZ01]